MVYHWDKQSNWVLYNYSLKVLFCLCFYFWWLIILFLVTMHLLTLKRAELRTLIALLGKCLKHHRQLDNQRLKSNVISAQNSSFPTWLCHRLKEHHMSLLFPALKFTLFIFIIVQKQLHQSWNCHYRQDVCWSLFPQLMACQVFCLL